MIRITQTIPELLPGRTLTQLARLLNTTRATVRKYVNDTTGTRHIVINGRLMVHHPGGRRYGC